jgi:hypothetical protein
MIITQDILRRDTVRLIKQIDEQIEQVEKEAVKMGILPSRMRDNNGGWTMSPLLMAKAQAYNTLVLLQTGK